MADYGHDLLFGSFLTPSNQHPEAVIALAQLSEQAGLDLATFQDHPYQSGFLDTWTLLSYVAARTERIHLSANVLNLPLRPPAVVARSAASLDLLSGGRVELGLGAGAFWDGIAAMGGQRLTPGQGVQALDEAIDIIRGIWDAANPAILRVPGKFHRVDGAKRGPAPAHAIGIWIGAYKPRMLRLTGRKGDGWLPSLGYLKNPDEDLAAANAVIDAAATDAGRDPRDVRRLLNVNGRLTARGQGLLVGPPEQWVEELTELAMSHGISAFILGGDDPRALQTFGHDVAPAVREALARERATSVRDDGAASVGGSSSRSAAGASAVEHRGDANGTDTIGNGTDAVGQESDAVGTDAVGQESDAAGTDAVGQESDAAGQYERLGVTPTPDDGVRLSPSLPWEESTRPRRGGSGPEVTYGAQSRALGKHLIDVHDMLRKELTEVRSIVAQVRKMTLDVGSARSALNDMTMRQNNWTLGAYCARYCTTVTGHHSLEDESVFPHLRRQERDLEPVIDRLEEEHVVIHGVVEEIDRALVAFVADPEDFTRLEAAVDLLTDTLLSHLSYEEEQLVEPLARYGFYAGQV